MERANSIGSWNTTPILRRSATQLHVADVDSVDADRAALRIEHAVQQAERGRLAGAGRADQSDGLARPHDEADVVHRLAALVIGEGHVVEHHFAGQPAGIDRVGLVGDARRRVHDLEKVADLGRLHEQKVHEADDLLQSRDQHGGEIHEGDDDADGRQMLEMQPDADDEDGEQAQCGRSARRHRRQRPPRQHRQLRRQHLIDDLPDPARLALDAREGLDDRNVAEHVGGAFGQLGVVHLDLRLQPFRPAQHENRQQAEKRRRGRPAPVRAASSRTRSRAAG